MNVSLAPGESLLPGTSEALDELFADARVEAVLLPLVPQGERALARAARRYLGAWDRRFLHAQNYFAPAARVVSRTPLPGPRNADAAPALAALLDQGGRVEALATHGVATRVGDDLSAWTGHFRAEGEAWGALAARDPRFSAFLPPPWWRHNVAQLGRRVIEGAQALRSVAPLPLLLHLTRESAWSQGCTATLEERSSEGPTQ